MKYILKWFVKHLKDVAALAVVKVVLFSVAALIVFCYTYLIEGEAGDYSVFLKSVTLAFVVGVLHSVVKSKKFWLVLKQLKSVLFKPKETMVKFNTWLSDEIERDELEQSKKLKEIFPESATKKKRRVL